MFDKKNISFGILNAIFFSAFIYLQHYGFTCKIIDTIFGLFSLVLFLYIPKKAIPWSGFFIGLFWFYWIGYSFKYQHVEHATFIVAFGFGIIYALFFSPLAFTKEPLTRALILFGLSFIEPFGFNWMKIELVFINSYIGIFKYDLILILLALSLPHYLKKYKYAPLLLILLSINYQNQHSQFAPLKIKLVQTNIKQNEKWLRKNLKPTILLGYKEITKAISQHYDIIVLPESFFPFYMNRHKKIIDTLKDLSKNITIIAGSLNKQNNKNYNVTYIFKNGTYKIAKKVVLVPFGEYIPLPKFAQKIINDVFFAGSADFTPAQKPTDFIIKGVKFRNAICYEATSDAIYDKNIKYIIATSNNAWFAPSIEPTLQKLLMRFYAKKYNVTIYHSANYKGTGIIKF